MTSIEHFQVGDSVIHRNHGIGIVINNNSLSEHHDPTHVWIEVEFLDPNRFGTLPQGAFVLEES